MDDASRVFGYENLMVCDGSNVPANPGVNPSLAITAMSGAMSLVPGKSRSTFTGRHRATAARG